MNLFDCVLCLALAQKLGTDIRDCAIRCLRQCDNSAIPYMNMIVASTSPDKVVSAIMDNLEVL